LKIESVVSLPGLSATSSCLVVTVTFAQSTRLLASSRKTTRFAVLVDWLDDPIDAGIPSDCLVLGVNEDDLEVLVCRVLIDPVRVENTEIGAATSNPLLCG
jgi:hypothetical protein